MNEKGITLQTLIILAIGVTIAIIGSVVITQAITSSSDDVEQAGSALLSVTADGCDWDNGFISENGDCYIACWEEGNLSSQGDIMFVAGEPSTRDDLFFDNTGTVRRGWQGGGFIDFYFSTNQHTNPIKLTVDLFQTAQKQGWLPQPWFDKDSEGRRSFNTLNRAVFPDLVWSGNDVMFRHPGVLSRGVCNTDGSAYEDGEDWEDGYIFSHRRILVSEYETN